MGTNKLFLDLSRRARLIAFLVALIFSQKEALALEDFLMAVPSKTLCSAYLHRQGSGLLHHRRDRSKAGFDSGIRGSDGYHGTTG